MKVLAVNYQNPFTDPQAKANISNAVRALNVDLVRFKLRNRIHERILRNDAIAWFRRPSPSMVNVMCIPCRIIAWDILKIAKKHKAPCVVGGANPFERTAFKKELHGVPRDENYYLYITKAAYNVLKQMLGNPRYFSPVCIPTMVKGYAFAVINTISPTLFGLDIPMVELFDYIEWNEEEVLSRLRSEIAWNYPEKLGPWRFDCRIGHLKDLMYLKTIAMTEKDDFYAKMVRDGLITRSDALLRLENENKIHLDQIQLVFNQVGIKNISVLNEVNGCSIA